MPKDNNQSQPDPKALQLHDRLFQAFQPQITILFGSRARGDFRPDSDLDLILVQPEPHKDPEHPWHQDETAQKLAAPLYEPQEAPTIQLVQLTPERFATSLRSVNGVAARAILEGYTLTQPGTPKPQWNYRQLDGEVLETNRLYSRAKDRLSFAVKSSKFPILAEDCGQEIFYAYRNALMHAYSKNSLYYDHTLPLVELAKQAPDHITTIGKIAKSRRLPLLDRYYERKRVKFPHAHYPNWSRHILAAQREIAILLGDNPTK